MSNGYLTRSPGVFTTVLLAMGLAGLSCGRDVPVKAGAGHNSNASLGPSASIAAPPLRWKIPTGS